MRKAVRSPLIVAVLAILVSALGAAIDPRRLSSSYFAAFAFGISIAIGALLLIMITTAAHATWFVVLRRTTEAVAATMPLFAALFIPVAFMLRALYPWARGGEGEAPEVVRVLAHQRPWLNAPFFLVRAAIYFAIWIAIVVVLRRASVGNDEDPRPELVIRQRAVSAVGLPVVALTLTFAAFDWLMSLNAGWTSDMFGVYFFAGGFGAAVGLTAVAAYFAHRAALIPEEVSAAHFHALGRLLLMTVIFWTYIAYAQFFLVWIANLPREITFFADRRRGVWVVVNLILLFGHFAVPFFALLSRPLKRRPGALAIAGGWLVLAHAVDIYWLVVPAARRGANAFDAAPMVAVFALAVAFGTWRFFAAPPYPRNDPDLGQSLRYESP